MAAAAGFDSRGGGAAAGPPPCWRAAATPTCARDLRRPVPPVLAARGPHAIAEGMSAEPPAPPRLRHVFVRGLELRARLGVHAHEKAAPQRILVHVDLAVRDDGPDIGPDTLKRVVDYEQVVNTARAAVAGGHVLLVETLAETLAAMALRDPRVVTARVAIEKPDAFPDAAAVGVVVERSRPPQPTDA